MQLKEVSFLIFSYLSLEVMADRITLQEALQNVDFLDDLPLPDKQPCIEAAQLSVNYQVKTP